MPYVKLWKDKLTIESLTKHHLGLGNRDTCIVARPRNWIRGGFNVCIPIEVQSPGSSRKLILRCAMPHKLAEARHSGSVDEKTACEVGTYVWMQERCPDIPIPHLYGFGFSDHRHVGVAQRSPMFLSPRTRCIVYTRGKPAVVHSHGTSSTAPILRRCQTPRPRQIPGPPLALHEPPNYPPPRYSLYAT